MLARGSRERIEVIEYGPHVGARKGPALADILGFYQAFGFRPGPAAAELPDHIGTELEFLGLLLLKEADARGRGAAADAARVFFVDHVAPWAPAFSGALREAARHPFYAAAAALLRQFLEGEAARLGCTLGEGDMPTEGSPGGCVACPWALAGPPDAA